MNPADLVAALRARWKLLLLLGLVVFGAIGVWTLIRPRVYVATASLLFDETSPDPVGDGSGPRTSLLGTQADIIKSEVLASQVVKTLGLSKDESVVARWQAATGGSGSAEAWLGRTLLGNLDVVAGKNSNVLGVVYRSNDPVFAALMANAFASAYVDARLQFQVDPAKTYTRWYEDRTAEVRGKLEAAQNALVKFRRERGIVDDGSISAENIRLSELSRLLVGAQADAAQARAGSGASSSAVQDSATVQALRADIARKSAEISQARTIYGPNHPTIVASTAELSVLQSKMGAAIGTAASAQRMSSGAASYREGDLRNAIATQRARMLALTADRSKIEVLQRDVDSARAAFDNVTQRLAAMRLQSELPRTNVRQLDEARAPSLPAEPNVPLLLALGFVVAVMVAISTGVALEWFRPLIRTPEGLVRLTGVPIATRVVLSHSSVMPLLGHGSSR